MRSFIVMPKVSKQNTIFERENEFTYVHGTAFWLVFLKVVALLCLANAIFNGLSQSNGLSKASAERYVVLLFAKMLVHFVYCFACL